jgi:hypothetical protein
MKPKLVFSARAMLASTLLAATSALFFIDAAPTSGAVTPQVSICSVVNEATSLRVSRGIPLNPTKFSFSRLVFVKQAASAQVVAVALCALPAMPTGVLSCPNDFGFKYSLLFSVPNQSVTDVRLDPTGCESVSGLGAVRWTEQSPNFYRVLGPAMGLKGAAQSTFAGKLDVVMTKN